MNFLAVQCALLILIFAAIVAVALIARDIYATLNELLEHDKYCDDCDNPVNYVPTDKDLQ
jgi:hypothetical protein